MVRAIAGTSIMEPVCAKGGKLNANFVRKILRGEGIWDHWLSAISGEQIRGAGLDRRG